MCIQNPAEYLRRNFFVKIVSAFKRSTIFQKVFIVDVRLRTKYTPNYWARSE